MRTLLSVLGPLVLVGGALAQEPAGSLAGTVTDSVTRAPVSKAQVLVFPRGVTRTRMNRPPQENMTTTDASGSFSFRDLPPGRYFVQARHPRYPGSTLPPRTLVEVAPGVPAQTALQLTPGGSISGRVLDADGDPLFGCFVSMRPALNQERGFSMLGSQPTDESGEYRVWGVQPGKYIAVAQCGRPPFQPRALSPVTTPPPPPTLAYPPVFYPSGTDRKSAQVIELAAGVEKTNVDFRMGTARVYTVRGTVTPPAANWPGFQNMFVTLAPREADVTGIGGRAGRVDPATGAFEIWSVLPGSYTLIAIPQGPDNLRFGIRQPVEVVDRSVEMTVPVRPAIDLVGKLEVDDPNYPELGRIAVQFQPVDRMGMMPATESKGDGTFTVKGLLPGLWRVNVWGPNVYVKSVEAGGREMPGRTVDATNGLTGELRVLLGTKVATIAGTAPPSEQISVMASDDAGMMRYAMSDGAGQFSLGGLPPGTYRVWISGDDDTNAREVRVSEGDTAKVELRRGSSTETP